MSKQFPEIGATYLQSVPISGAEPTDGQILVKNDTTGQWEPSAPAAGMTVVKKHIFTGLIRSSVDVPSYDDIIDDSFTPVNPGNYHIFAFSATYAILNGINGDYGSWRLKHGGNVKYLVKSPKLIDPNPGSEAQSVHHKYIIKPGAGVYDYQVAVNLLKTNSALWIDYYNVNFLVIDMGVT